MEINTTEGMGVMGVVKGRLLTEIALVSSSSSVSKSGIVVVTLNFGETCKRIILNIRKSLKI